MGQLRRREDELIELAKRGKTEALRLLQLRKRQLLRVIKTIGLMVAATLLIVPVMITSGLLLGPRGYEGLLLTPLVLMATWAAIWYWMLGRKIKPKALVKSKLDQLPAQTEAWLDEQRSYLPLPAQTQLDSLTLRLQNLTPQLVGAPAEAPAGHELRRLLAEELPDLVRHYRAVPQALTRESRFGGKTPEHQLIEGLQMVNEHLAQVQERIAHDPMHALATHQRYLELKYKKKDE